MQAGTTCCTVLRDDDMAKALIMTVDFLPRDYFDRIIPLLSLMGDELINRVDAMMASGKIKPDERESNILGFLFSGREAVNCNSVSCSA